MKRIKDDDVTFAQGLAVFTLLTFAVVGMVFILCQVGNGLVWVSSLERRLDRVEHRHIFCRPEQQTEYRIVDGKVSTSTGYICY